MSCTDVWFVTAAVVVGVLVVAVPVAAADVVSSWCFGCCIHVTVVAHFAQFL